MMYKSLLSYLEIVKQTVVSRFFKTRKISEGKIWRFKVSLIAKDFTKKR